MKSEDFARLYTCQEIPHKGHALLAATHIAKGTRILSESPLFKVCRAGDDKKRIHDSVSKEISALDEESRKAFLALHNSFEDEGPGLGRVRTNALPLGSDVVMGAIFLESSRINHSCDPNAQNTWNDNIQKLTIHAIRDIAKAAEITIFYLPERRNHEDRQRDLLTKFRFTCFCNLCSLPHKQRKASDERWDEIQSLMNQLAMV
jgi:SET domain-containing protein